MNGKCISARIEVMPNVLALAREYLKIHPFANEKDAFGAGYMAYRLEMQRQTIAFKEKLKATGGL